MRAVRHVCLCFPLLLAACTSEVTPRTQVMVVIDAESQVRKLAADIDLEVRTGTGPVNGWDPRAKRSLTPGAGIDWPLEAALVPKEGDADRVYLVVATARDKNGDAVAEVRAISGYQKGKTLSLLLLFENACLDKVDLCSETQTCRRGDCVDAHVDPKGLPEYGSDAGPDAASGGSGGESDAGDRDGSTAHDAATDAEVPAKSCDTAADCDDAEPCNGVELCVSNKCKAGKAVVCKASGDVCRPNVCSNDRGKAVCAQKDAEDGISCKGGDASSSPAAMCARDYQCLSGQCEPQTVETCTATQCEATAGCDADDGCVFEPLDVSTTCDDGDMCTDADHCSGTDGACVGTAKGCSDGVACTVDSCDVTGTCQHTVDHAACGGPCKTGTCDPVAGCQNVISSQDFTDCSDGNAATTQDLCYRGECLGGKQGAPTASCQLAGCTCSGFGSVKDLQIVSNKYLALIDTLQNGGGGSCTVGTVSNVFDVTLGALTAFGSDTSNGGVSESGADLNYPYAISSTHIGTINTTTQTVAWTNTTYGNAVAAQTPNITNFRGSHNFTTGNTLSTGYYRFFLWGIDSTTSTTGRITRCDTCSSTIVGGCANTNVVCTDLGAFTSTSVMSVLPYVHKSAQNNIYDGLVTLVNFASGTYRKVIYEDGTGKDMVPSQTEANDTDGAWSSLLRLSGAGQVLATGSGSNNVRLCTDAGNTGDTSCAAISGLPNQSVRAYSRSDTLNTAIAMLATTGSNSYLLLLPSGLDPATGSNWREIQLASSGTTVVNGVGLATASFMVIGKTGTSPWVWYWGPP